MINKQMTLSDIVINWLDENQFKYGKLTETNPAVLVTQRTYIYINDIENTTSIVDYGNNSALTIYASDPEFFGKLETFLMSAS